MRDDAIVVHYDSQSIIYLAKNKNSYHKRTKNIDVKNRFIRDTIAKKRLILEKIPTTENPTDMLTKDLPLVKFTLCVRVLMS